MEDTFTSSVIFLPMESSGGMSIAPEKSIYARKLVYDSFSWNINRN